MDSIHERWHPESGMQLVLDFTAPKPATPQASRAPRSTGPLITPPPTKAIKPVPAAGRPPVGRARLLGRIRRALEVPADLVVTDNRRTMISTKRRGERLEVRLHHMFLDAPDEVVEELLSYLTEGDPRASRRIGRFIEENRDRIKRRGRRVLLRTSGQHHDLEELLETVTREHLPEAGDGASITWGRCPPKKGRRRRRRSIRLGTYTHDSQLIRIHPALDQATVPRFFVAFVVFHELLHHVVPAREVGGRFDHHPPEFKRRERAHPDYAAAVRWEAENLDLLLRFRG